MIEKIKLLKNHIGFKRYFKNTSWIFAEKIFRMIMGLFVGIWVVRYLGPQQFGLFSYAQSFVVLFTSIATLGLDQIVVRELVKDESRRNDLLGTAFWLKFIAAFVTLLLMAAAINLILIDSYTKTLIFIIASAVIFQSFNVVDLYFQSKVMSKFVAYSNTISLLMSSIVKIWLILNQAPLIAFAWVVLFDSFSLACGYIYFYIATDRKFNIKNFKLNMHIAKFLLKNSWPLALSGVIITIYMKIDQVMIKEMMDVESVGQYASAARLSEAWFFIPMAIASSVFPAIVNAKKRSEELYLSRLQKLYDTMVWMALAIAIPMTLFSTPLVELLYGERFSEAGSVLMIHIWTGVFVYLGVAFSKYLTIENYTKKFFNRTIVGAASNILLNFILIPKYGINGAAMATFLGQFIANYVCDIFDKDLHQQLKMKTMSFVPLHIFKNY